MITSASYLFSIIYPAYLTLSVSVPWSVLDFQEGAVAFLSENSTKDAAWGKRYPALSPEIHVSTPSLVVDNGGRIMAVYLPDIMSPSSMVRSFDPQDAESLIHILSYI
jgi:hypothetical protein